MEIKNTAGVVVYPAGIHVESPYNFSYYDIGIEAGLIVTQDISTPVTNYEYEEQIENEKRNIFLLKPRYLNVVKDDLEELMLYKKGSTQYMSETLKKADNIRLYQ